LLGVECKGPNHSKRGCSVKGGFGKTHTAFTTDTFGLFVVITKVGIAGNVRKFKQNGKKSAS